MLEKLKKNTKWSIREVGTFKIDDLKSFVLNLSFEWDLDKSRQETYKTHEKTKMYQICHSDYSWVPGTEVVVLESNVIQDTDANIEFKEIVKELEEKHDGKLVRAEFIKMLANTEIRTHVDGGAMLTYIRRCHIPIVTNELVTFTVFNNTINMLEGIGYEINNQLPHSVDNPSNEDRVHLIIDILPNEYFL